MSNALGFHPTSEHFVYCWGIVILWIFFGSEFSLAGGTRAMRSARGASWRPMRVRSRQAPPLQARPARHDSRFKLCVFIVPATCNLACTWMLSVRLPVLPHSSVGSMPASWLSSQATSDYHCHHYYFVRKGDWNHGLKWYVSAYRATRMDASHFVVRAFFRHSGRSSLGWHIRDALLEFLHIVYCTFQKSARKAFFFFHLFHRRSYSWWLSFEHMRMHVFPARAADGWAQRIEHTLHAISSVPSLSTI